MSNPNPVWTMDISKFQVPEPHSRFSTKIKALEFMSNKKNTGFKDKNFPKPVVLMTDNSKGSSKIFSVLFISGSVSPDFTFQPDGTFIQSITADDETIIDDLHQDRYVFEYLNDEQQYCYQGCFTLWQTVSSTSDSYHWIQCKMQ